MDLWLNWIEHLTTDQKVVGSSPARFTKKRILSALVKFFFLILSQL